MHIHGHNGPTIKKILKQQTYGLFKPFLGGAMSNKCCRMPFVNATTKYHK